MPNGRILPRPTWPGPICAGRPCFATFDESDLGGANFIAPIFGSNLINAKAPGRISAYLKDVLMEGIDLSGGSIRNCYAFAACFRCEVDWRRFVGELTPTGAATENADLPMPKLTEHRD